MVTSLLHMDLENEASSLKKNSEMLFVEITMIKGEKHMP